MHPDRGVQIDSRTRKHHVEDTLRSTHHDTRPSLALIQCPRREKTDTGASTVMNTDIDISARVSVC